VTTRDGSPGKNWSEGVGSSWEMVRTEGTKWPTAAFAVRPMPIWQATQNGWEFSPEDRCRALRCTASPAGREKSSWRWTSPSQRNSIWIPTNIHAASRRRAGFRKNRIDRRIRTRTSGIIVVPSSKLRENLCGQGLALATLDGNPAGKDASTTALSAPAFSPLARPILCAAEPAARVPSLSAPDWGGERDGRTSS
jgi:hypothetical protein